MTRRVLIGLFCCSVLSACAMSRVEQDLTAAGAIAERELGVAPIFNDADAKADAAKGRVDVWLQEPLTADRAVQIALTYSPDLQRLLAESAAASAGAQQLGRLPNPIAEYGRLSLNDVVEIDRRLSLSLIDLVLTPRRASISRLERDRLRFVAASAVLRKATDVRRAWVEAVAAEQSAVYAEQVQKAALAGARLGQRMSEAGNFARIEHAREQVFLADATTELARARAEATHRREVLVRLLGLRDAQVSALRLPERLPDLPAAAEDEGVLAKRAFDERLDVRIARKALEVTARSLGLTRVTSTVNALSVAGLRNSTPEGTARGFDIDLALPLFDFGDARRAGARATYLAALAETAAVASAAQSQLREGYVLYRTAFDVAVHYRDEVIPLHKTIADENLLRYNGMLISVFELLADARAQVTTVRQALRAQRDFWIADAALRATLVGVPLEPVALSAAPGGAGAGGAPAH